MDFIKIVLLAVVFLGFGFYSFQKGREYERSLQAGNQQTGKKKKNKE